MEAEKKLVFAPWGASMFGEDVLLFEHGLLLAMETAVEAAGGFAYADIHDQLGGADKREQPTPPLMEADIRTLAARAGCDALVDGMISPVRDPETGALAHVTVSPRVFLPRESRFVAPDSFTFAAFDPHGRPETLALDYDRYIALQSRLCAALLDALGQRPAAGVCHRPPASHAVLGRLFGLFEGQAAGADFRDETRLL